jgi:hypothetical protein
LGPAELSTAIAKSALENLLKAKLLIDFEDKSLILCIENHAEKLSTAQSTATSWIKNIH